MRLLHQHREGVGIAEADVTTVTRSTVAAVAIGEEKIVGIVQTGGVRVSQRSVGSIAA